MSVLKDYHCKNHGIFEAWEPVCPMKNCKGELSVVFLKPVGTRSAKTKHTDNTVKQLAMEYGMTDVKSTREGEHQTGYLARNNAPVPEQPPADRPGSAVMWGEAGKYNMQSMLGGMVKPVRDEQVGFSPKDANLTRGPMAASYYADHDNLKLDK